MNLAINLIGTSNESGSKTYCMNFFNNLIHSAQLKNYKKIIIFISRSYLKRTKINKFQGNIEIVAVNTIFSKGLFKIIYDQFFFPFLN
jgi:RNase P/RNase MRP subunit p30